MILKFLSEKHKYESLNEEDFIPWTSVTSLVSNFKQPFDADKIAIKSAKNRKSKWYKMDPEDIKAVWKAESKRATDLGTWYHNCREADICSLESMNRHDKDVPVIRPIYKNDIKLSPPQKLTDGVYPEHLVYLKSAGLCGQSDLVEVVNVLVHVSDYKGLALDTPIPTPQGFKLMQDIQEGDIIFDGNGKQTKVMNVSETHHNPCYRILFDTNDELVADHEHKWVITERQMTGRQKTRKGKYVDVQKTTEQLFQSISAGNILRIRCTSDLELDQKELPIDPYVLGVWLGDGSQSCGMVTNMTEEVWCEIVRRGYQLGKDVSNGGSGQAASRTILGLYTELRKLNLLKNKHIPDLYLTGSRKQRLDLLRGFMDADGYYNKTRKRCVAVTTKKWQVDAVMTLVSSLGWKPTVIKAKGKCTNCDNAELRDVFHVTFNAVDENPFLVRNQNIVTTLTVKSVYRYITSIAAVETVPTRCLAVDSSDHTYLAGRSYIKTHNTNKEIKTEGYRNWEGITQRMKAPLSHLDDCDLNHYAVQLSMYMYIILKHNPKLKPGNMTIHHILFEEVGKDKYGNPITALDNDGNPIVKDIVLYNLSYLREEMISLIHWIEDNKPKV